MEFSSEPADPQNSKQFAALRPDLTAALSAFDRAQDWAVGVAPQCVTPFATMNL